MNAFWSIAIKCLFAIVLIQAWFLYDMHRQNAELLMVNEETVKSLSDSETKVAELELQLAKMEKKTVDGILKETNKAVVQGWESLLDKVEQELEKAREVVPKLLELDPQNNNDKAIPEANEPQTESNPSPEQQRHDSLPDSPNAPPVLIPGDVT